MYTVNLISFIFFILFLLPIFVGSYKSFARAKGEATLINFFGGLEYLIALVLSFLLTKWIFFTDLGVFKIIKGIIPEDWNAFLGGQEILTNLVATPIIAFIILVLFRLLMANVYENLIIPASDSLKTKVEKSSPILNGLVNCFYQVPKSAFVVIAYALLLSYYSYYNFSPRMAGYTSTSKIYQFIYKSSVYHMLSPNLAKEVSIIYDKGSLRNDVDSLALNHGNKINDKGINIENYLNGQSVKEVVKSNNEIDNIVDEIIAGEDSKEINARHIYEWITKNIEFDKDKATKINKDPKGISSSAIICYSTKKGAGLDFTCLYTAMCRSAGIKVRFMTGLAYNGVSWGTHSWNQVELSNNRWVPVDTTFGIESNYFNKDGFYKDHSEGEVRGEW